MSRRALSEADVQRRGGYLGTPARQLGNLHERMRYVMELLREHTESVPHELANAIYDLETEVSYHTPAKPAYGRRSQ
jgi:hypothetical protein